MRTLTINEKTNVITLGYRQENEYQQVIYCYPADWEGGTINVFIRRPSETTSYPLANVSRDPDDGTVTFTVTNTDLHFAGWGAIEYQWLLDGVVAKTKVFRALIASDIISAEGEAPSGYDDWIASLTTLANTTTVNANAAANSATNAANSAAAAAASAATASAAMVHAPIIANGYWYVWNTTTGVYESTGVEAQGETGETGNGISSVSLTGQSGTNPVVDEYTITYTDGTTTTFTVTNGRKGDTGATGATGATGNGISSVAKTSTSGLTDTYTISFTDGTSTTFNVVNGNGIASITKTATVGLVDTYTITFTDGSTSTFTVTNGNDAKQYLKSVLPTDTAQGSIASFEDGTDVLPAKSVSVAIEPVQDLNGQSAPYPAGGGKNQFDAEATSNLRDFSRSGETFTNTYTDTRATIKWNALFYSNGSQIGVSNDATITTTGRHSLVINIPSGTDKLRIRDSGSNRDLYFEYAFNGEGSYTLSADFTSVDPTTIGGLVITNIQLESGSTATAYAPYSNICPISGWGAVDIYASGADTSTYDTTTLTLPQTVYGGTLDVVAGTVTVDRALMTIDGDYGGSMGITPLSNCTQVSISDYISVGVGNDNFVANTLKFSGASEGLHCIWNSTVPRMFLGLPTSVTTKAEALAWFASNPTTICYHLATPTTLSLTPAQIDTLLGDNNIWADAGEIDITYYADIQRYIAKKLAE